MNYLIDEGDPRGFFSVLLCVITSIQKIEEAGHGFLVRDNFKLYGQWTDYFLPVSNIQSPPFVRMFSETSCYFGNEIITDDQIAVLHAINEKYIKQSDRSREFVASTVFPEKYFAVHRRATDHHWHFKIRPMEDYYSVIDKKIDQYEYLYVATDEAQALDAFKARYGNKVIFQQDVTRSTTGAPVHSIHNRNMRLGYEVLTDCMALAHSSECLVTRSNISIYARTYNPKLKYIHLENEQV